MFNKILTIVAGLYILASALVIGYLYSFKTNELGKATQLGATQAVSEMNNSVVNQLKTNGFLPLNIDGQTINLVPYQNNSTSTSK